MKNIFLKEIVDWFVLIKAPQLKEKVLEAASLSDNGSELSENQRKLIAFTCFSYSMNRGPASFIGVRMVVEDISIEKEFQDYAKSWIEYGNKPKDIPNTKTT